MAKVNIRVLAVGVTWRVVDPRGNPRRALQLNAWAARSSVPTQPGPATAKAERCPMAATGPRGSGRSAPTAGGRTCASTPAAARVILRKVTGLDGAVKEYRYTVDAAGHAVDPHAWQEYFQGGVWRTNSWLDPKRH